MKRAFSLVELIVVIGIIGILGGVLFASFGGSTESARAAKCLSNLRNLSAAWSSGRAGSQEHMTTEYRNNRVKKTYTEAKGWISYATKGLYPSESHQTFDPIGLYETDRERVDHAFTNGWISTALGKDRSKLVCPTHVKKNGTARKANWSYFMSAYYGWDSSRGGYTYSDLVKPGYVCKSDMTDADRRLLFAEIPFRTTAEENDPSKGPPGNWFPVGDKGTVETDAILQYDGCDKAWTAAGTSRYKGSENIGGNHKSGRDWYAHVAFADGHVEKLRVTGLSGDELKELTTWLCTGTPIGRNGGKYEKVE